jgi:glutamyl-Q tRNA(Asp) synthetase
LVAALGSYLDARAAGGEWLVRMEDVDAPRCVPGADSAILRTLERFGLNWDGEVVYQSRRGEAYAEALESLRARGRAFPCACTRREVGDGPYPGTCRDGLGPGRQARSWRFRSIHSAEAFDDRRLGRIASPPPTDFVLLRADGYWAYQLAVVVDDAWQGITDIVRGEDLLESTPAQMQLQRSLGLAPTTYLHLPLARDPQGNKLSKQNRAPALDDGDPQPLLEAAMRFIGLAPPVGLSLSELLAWGVRAWPEATAGPR